MKHKTTFVIGLLVALLFIGYMVTYQVNFNQVAVVTTFGEARGDAVRDGGDPKQGLIGNLHLRWPWPVQNVRLYDKRVQVLEDRLEEQQTKDKQGVIINAYVTWRILDPLHFYRSLQTEEAARRQIRSLLRDARSVIGNYTFDELTNTDPEKLKLPRAENDILTKMNNDLDRQKQQGQPWGIEFQTVGLKRIELPQSVTRDVFSRMRATRQRLAQQARSEGDAIAADIKARAESARKTILSFVERRAQEIRSRGDAAAARYYDVFEKNERFAIFLRKMETYADVLGHNSTFIFDTKKGLFPEFYTEPTQTVKPPERPPEQGDDESE